jgi:hypothetical protein
MGNAGGLMVLPEPGDTLLSDFRFNRPTGLSLQSLNMLFNFQIKLILQSLLAQ